MSMFDPERREDLERRKQVRRRWINRGVALGLAALTVAAAVALGQGGGHPPAIILLPVVIAAFAPFAAIGAVAGVKERAVGGTPRIASTLALTINLAVAMYGMAAVALAIVLGVVNVALSLGGR